eukprot:2481877-Rhodomonas_salina.1
MTSKALHCVSPSLTSRASYSSGTAARPVQPVSTARVVLALQAPYNPSVPRALYWLFKPHITPLRRTGDIFGEDDVLSIGR